MASVKALASTRLNRLASSQLKLALAETRRLLSERAGSPEVQELLSTTGSTAATRRVLRKVTKLLQRGRQIAPVKLVANSELGGDRASFGLNGEGRPRILVNRDWLAGANDTLAVMQVLLQQISEAIQARFQPGTAAAVEVAELLVGGAQIEAIPVEPVNPPQESPETPQPLFALSGEPTLALHTALQEAQQLIESYFNGEGALERLFGLLHGGSSEPSDEWLASAQAFLAGLEAGTLSVRVEQRASTDLLGAYGAYAPAGPDGQPVIYLNLDWVALYSKEQLTRLILEEAGHWIDNQINGAIDTPGDEGEALAAAVLGLELSESEWARILSENDTILITIDGEVIEAESARTSTVGLILQSGFLGTQGNNTNQANSILKLETLGIRGIGFFQVDVNGDGKFGDGGTQGNDLAGTLIFYFNNGTTLTRTGALNWRETTGNEVEVFGFILDPNQDDFTINYGDNKTFTLVSGTTRNSSSTIGLKSILSSFTFTDGQDRSGNAATPRLLDALNDELASSAKISTVVSNADAVEGNPLAFTVALDRATPTEQLFSFFTTGTATSNIDYSKIYTFTNGVIDNGDGTITVPAGVTSFTVTITTFDDSEIEPTETVILTIGGVSGTGNILDNDVPTLTVSNVTLNEGSPWAVFTVTGAAGQAVFLSLSGASGDSPTEIAGGAADLGSTPALQFFDGTTWQTYNANNPPLIAEGQTTLLVRVDISNERDTALDGPETFTLVATNSGDTPSTGGLGTIVDDGTGGYFADDNTTGISELPAGVFLDDDRTLSITGTDVNEASPYVLWTIGGAEGQIAFLAVEGTGSKPATPGTDTSGPLQVLVAGAWVNYDSINPPAIPAGGQLLVRVAVVNDDNFEGTEALNLIATNTGGTDFRGQSTISDDGTGDIFLGNNLTNTPNKEGDTDPDGPDFPDQLDDDRSINVTGLDDVSEGTNAVFTVALSNNPTGTQVGLTLGASGDTAGAADYNPLTNATAYYFIGNVKTVLTITNGKVILPPGITSFLVSVRTIQDSEYEGPETFTLTATAFGNKQGSDTSTILDDGTGRTYDDKGVPISGATPDDDRTLAVTAFGPVNEASDWALFTVTAVVGSTLDLNLQNASSGTAASWPGFPPLQFSTDGTTWTTYTGTGTGQPTVPPSGTVYVRVDIRSEQDENFEGSETFALRAAYTTNTSKTAFADTSIVDDGTGKKYGPNFSGGVPQESSENLDTDTGLSVNSITVNENSPFAVFTVSGAANLPVSLELTNVSSTGLIGLAYSLDDGATWTNYDSGTVPLPASGRMLVRTSLMPEQESLFENSETFTLTATPDSGTAATGTATIKDDGTGTIFNNNGTTNNTAVKDDDRALAVNSISVNEGSPFAVFTLTAHVGQSLILGFSNGIQNTTARPGDGTPADGTEDYDPTSLQVWDPTANSGNGDWVAYNGAFAVRGEGVGTTPVLVRVKINNDPIFEGPEDFRLTATYTSGAARSATGVATIRDDGTGIKFPDAAPNSDLIPVTVDTDLDDDRLLVSVSNVTVTEGVDPFALVNVTISREASTAISFTPFLSEGTATLNSDFGPLLQWRPAGSTDENAWADVSGPLTIPVGQTGLQLRTAIIDDNFFEPTERFTINTGLISGPVANPSGAVGTVTIIDNDQFQGELAVTLLSTGNETGSVPNVFRISRTGDTTAPLVVPFTISGIRKLGIDYGDPTTQGVTFDPATGSGTITIPVDALFADLSIPTVDNEVVDGTRALPLSLGAVPNYTISKNSAQGSILDNDSASAPVVSIGKGNVVEPDLGQIRFVNLSIQLSAPATQDTVITYDVIPATPEDLLDEFGNARLGFDGQPLQIATPDVDYTPISGRVTLAAGLTSTIIAVPIIGDNIDENDEVLYARIVSVSGGNGATISTSENRGEIIIIDNENTSGLNIDYSTSPNGIEIRGGTGNDVIIGSNFNDTIFGNEGNDYIQGGLGADILTGGAGADIFSYTDTRESVLTAIDRIRDFAPGGGLSTGDRIQFSAQAALDLQTATGSITPNGLPSALYNASLPTALTDLNLAIQAAFKDKDLSTTGDQALGLGEAVIFTQRSGRVTNTYMIVNTGTTGYDSSTDFMVNITGWFSSGFGRGQLAVSDFFQSSVL